MFRDGWLNVNGVSSHIMTWGGWVEDPLPDEGDSIVVFMCGVPGITLFYQSFLDTLYSRLKMPIWTICIAGHELPPPSSNLELPPESKLYDNVQAQIAHKRAFIMDYVPKQRKIYFIGHSFGAKMITELLKDEQISSRVQKCLLLMPTLERFGETPRAKFWLMMYNTGLIYTLVFLSWLLHVLPESWQRMFVRWYFWSRGLSDVPDSCHEAMLTFLHPKVFHNTRALVWDELEAIQGLDKEVLMDLSPRIKVYFAQDDYWAPLTHYHSLRCTVPELVVEVLDDRFTHAFSLGTARDMADIISRDLTTTTSTDCVQG